jgi:hypothetical protein
MCALRSRPLPPALTPADLRFLRTVADDTEDAPNDRQWRDASALFWSLETYAQSHPVPWYPGGMLPLTYPVPGEPERKTIAPDVFAATVPIRGRSSLPVDEEGMPPLVLEVVSSSSVKRDLEEKTEIYRLLGAHEYAIVRLDLAEVRLEGYQRGATGAWEAWAHDAQGRLWSNVLGLGLVLREGEVRAVTREGELLRTPPEAEAERRQAEAARQAEAQARVQADAARQEAEEELARLRAMLERLTRGEEQAAE